MAASGHPVSTPAPPYMDSSRCQSALCHHLGSPGASWPQPPRAPASKHNQERVTGNHLQRQPAERGGGGSTQSKGSTAPPWPFRKPRPCSHSPWGSREAACFSWASVPLLSIGSASTSGRFSLPAFGFCVLFFSCGCCCLEITCKLKIFSPCIFLPTLPPFFFSP